MRSVLSRRLVPAVTLLFAALSTASLSSAADSVVMRGAKPWIHIGGKYTGPKAVDAETRSRAVVSSIVGSRTSLAVTGVDRFGDGDTIVRLGQTHHGLPVIGRGASVRLGPSGQPIATTVDLASDLPSTATLRLSARRAAEIASTAMPFRARGDESHLVVWPTFDRGSRLAYAVMPHLPVGIASQPRIIVDAETGEILQARDMVRFASATTYEFNPTRTPALVSRELLVTPGSKLTSEFLESTNCIDKKSVRSVSLGVGFNISVHVCDLEQTATADGSGNFDYAPADQPGSVDARSDAYSEVSIYYHSAKAYAFFRQLQGDPAAQVVTDKPLRLVANLQMPAGMMSGDLSTAKNPDIALETFQNAFFSPASGGLGEIFQQLYGFNGGALWFGQGPQRDYSYDGDVVYHEFGHAVVDHTIKLEAWHIDAFGAIDAPGAMNEGLADYFSSAITGDPEVGEYAAADMSGEANIRTLANSDKCPSALAGEVHYDSTLFSGGLWQARQSLPEADRSKLDAGIYKALRSNPGEGDLGFDDLVKLFETTLKQDFPAGAEALTKAMTERGVLPGCDRVLTYAGSAIKSPYARFGFAAPGKQSVSVKGTAPGILQVRAAVPANTASVKISFKADTRGGGAQNPLGGGGKGFTPVILAKVGAPIQWTPKGNDATIKVAPEAAEDLLTTATVAIPEGSTGDVYLQIASTGDSDGAYDDIALTFVPVEGAAEEPPAEAPVASGPSSSSGCSASSTRGGTTMLSGVGLAAALTLAARRRRPR